MNTNNNVRLISSDGNELLFYNDKCLYNPEKQNDSIQRKIEQLIIPERRLILWISPLKFFGYEQLINKLPDNSTLITIEPDPELFAVSSSYIKEHKIKIQLSKSTPDIEACIRQNQNIRGIHEIRLNRIISPSDIISHIKKECSYRINVYWKNRYTSMHMAKLWLKNIFINLSRDRISIPSPGKAITKSDNALVIGAGVSTEIHINKIKEFRGTIFAVDTALRCLNAFGIQPDYAVALEGQFYNVDDIAGFDSRKTVLLADICSSPVLINNWKGQIIFYCTRFQELNLFTSIHGSTSILQVPPLGSVGVTASYLASLFAQKIVTVGLDFSYPAGKTHAKASPAHDLYLRSENRLFRMLHSLKASYNRRSEPIIYTDNNENQWISDDILTSYAENMSILTIAKLGPQGLLNKPVAESLDKLTSKIDIDISTISKKSLLLNNLHEALTLGETEIRLGGERMLQFLSENDYLTADFPDPPTLELTKNPLYIKRVLQSLYFFKGLLEKIK